MYFIWPNRWISTRMHIFTLCKKKKKSPKLFFNYTVTTINLKSYLKIIIRHLKKIFFTFKYSIRYILFKTFSRLFIKNSLFLSFLMYKNNKWILYIYTCTHIEITSIPTPFEFLLFIHFISSFVFFFFCLKCWYNGFQMLHNFRHVFPSYSVT